MAYSANRIVRSKKNEQSTAKGKYMDGPQKQNAEQKSNVKKNGSMSIKFRSRRNYFVLLRAFRVVATLGGEGTQRGQEGPSGGQ